MEEGLVRGVAEGHVLEFDPSPAVLVVHRAGCGGRGALQWQKLLAALRSHDWSPELENPWTEIRLDQIRGEHRPQECLKKNNFVYFLLPCEEQGKLRTGKKPNLFRGIR